MLQLIPFMQFLLIVILKIYLIPFHPFIHSNNDKLLLVIPKSSSSSTSHNNNNSGSHGSSSNSTINQQEQPRLSVQNSQQKLQPTLMDMSSYGLNDDISNIRSLDTMDLLSTSPPKQTGKAPSIFSPERNEKSSSLASNNGNNLLSGIDHGSNGGSDTMNAIPSLSPKKEYDKRAMLSDDISKKNKHSEYHQQQQQQQHQHQNQHHQSHRSGHHSDKSMNVKREISLSSGMQYDASLPQILLDGKAVKRSYNADMGQLDSLDYQQPDMKVRKTEQLSPIQNVSELAKSAMSMGKSYNGVMESPNSDKYGKVGEYSKGSGNAVSITTDLVNSLIKESLNDGGATKYGATLDAHQKKPSSSAKHQQHQVMDAREQSTQQQQQPPMMKTEEIDRSQSANQQYSSQHSQYRVDAKRAQQVSVPAMSRQPPMVPPSKGVAPNVDEKPFNEQQQQQQISQFQQEPNNQNVYGGAGGGQALPQQLQVKTDQRVKSEKKKKKEKHKNKDKEKSKNREERKKHKKDKDRHKDKRKSPSSGHETSVHDTKSPIRLKLNLSHTEHHASSSTTHYDSHSGHNESIGVVGGAHSAQGEQQLKLKITRDRIKPDLDATLENKQLLASSLAPASSSTATPTSFKIKIPKQVVQNYNSGGENIYNSQQMHSNELGHAQTVSGSVSGSSSSAGGGGSTKKKDKNRERDRSMQNSANLSNRTKVSIPDNCNFFRFIHLA